jgi:Domain of unknown function (DUF4062)
MAQSGPQAHETADDYLEALRGNFAHSVSGVKLAPPKRVLEIFVSSTFTDTHDERNILLNELLPRCRETARQFGVQVFFFDLRSGIPDANTLDHATWDGCKRELIRCFNESGSLAFLSLQASKYGYMPLPKTIDKIAYEARLDTVCKEDDARILANEWYRLDENAMPPVYILKNLTGNQDQDNEFWSTVRPKLCKVFDNVVFDTGFDDGIIGRSVTEYEAKSAIALCEGNLSRLSTSIHWLHRRFREEPSEIQDPKGFLYDGRGDPSVTMKLSNLKAWMRSLLPPSCIQEIEIDVDAYNEKGDNPMWQVKIIVSVTCFDRRICAYVCELFRLNGI